MDLSEEGLKTFVEQYDTGDVLFKGKWVKSSNLEIEIRETPYVTTYVFPQLNPFTIFGTTSAFPDVTRKFIKSPPKEQAAQNQKARKPLSKDVFIVHGTDFTPVEELKAIIVESGLNPIILHEQPSKGMTLIEKLEKYSNVEFAFIILTPDDTGLARKEVGEQLESLLAQSSLTVEDLVQNTNEIPYQVIQEVMRKFFGMLKDRARQNVVLEFGYFIGRLSRARVCCLYKGDIELPSDMHGICYVHFNSSLNEVKDMIVKELREAGYEIRK